MTKIEEALGLTKRSARSLHAPMKYPGSKRDCLEWLLPQLPYRESYIEPFGGSGSVLIARKAYGLEVFNDRYAGVTAFYRVLREQCDALVSRLELIVHSREEWEWCLKTWEDPNLTDLERAARWYYMLQFSFLGKGHCFARITSNSSAVAGTIGLKLTHFPALHARFALVQIENLDFRECLRDYDNKSAVFYCDPPYYKQDSSSYSCKMAEYDHIALLDFAMQAKGFVAISGYANELYDSYKWDQRTVFMRRDRANAQATSEHNHRNEPGERELKEEVLWIKNP